MKKEKNITFKIHRADCQCIIADIESMTLKEEELSVIFEYGIKTDMDSVLKALRIYHSELNIIGIKSVDVVESVYSIPCTMALLNGHLEKWNHLGDCYNWFSSPESEVENND